MAINPKKLLKRERQLKAVIGMSGKEFKILHEQFNIIYNKSQQRKPRKVKTPRRRSAPRFGFIDLCGRPCYSASWSAFAQLALFRGFFGRPAFLRLLEPRFSRLFWCSGSFSEGCFACSAAIRSGSLQLTVQLAWDSK